MKTITKELGKMRIEILLFLLTLVVYSYFLTGLHSANEGSALALTEAIVNYHKLSIDEYKDLASVDISQYNDHYYSDKDIGRALFAIPIYVADKALGFTSDIQVDISIELMTAMISAASVVLLYRFVIFLKGTRGTALAVSLVYAFATILFSFSKTFFAHPYSAFFNLMGLFAMLVALRDDERKYLIYSGISFAIAMLMEYTNVFAIAIIFCYYLYKSRLKNILYLIVPFLVIASVIPMYNYAIFKDFFTTTYNHQLSYGNIDSIYFRADYLKEGLRGLLVSSWRGLFYYSPVLVLSIAGFCLWMFDKDEKKNRLLPIVLVLASASVLIFYAASPAWRGGNSYGPRYLIAVMPFIVLPMMKMIEKFKSRVVFWMIFAVLFAYSAVFAALGSFVGPAPAENFTNPFWQSLLPTFRTGYLDSYMFSVIKPSLALMIVAEFCILILLSKEIELARKVKSLRH